MQDMRLFPMLVSTRKGNRNILHLAPGGEEPVRINFFPI